MEPQDQEATVATGEQGRFSSAARFSKNVASFSLKNKWKILVGGGIVGIIVGFLLFISSFLAAFKLDFATKNIEKVRMARLIHIFDGRSDRFVRALVMAEIAGDNSDGRNRYFMAKGWYENHNPAMKKIQAIRDNRTNKFFDRLERDQGIRFAREAGGLGEKDRLVLIRVDGTDINFNDALSRVGGLDPSTVTDFENLIDQRFDSNKAARRAYNAKVKETIKPWHMVKRYQMRKWGYERLGIRKWRIFENTRDNVREKMQKQWNKVVGVFSNNGRAFKCIIFSDGCVGDNPNGTSLNDDTNRVDVSTSDPSFEDAQNEAERDSRTGGGDGDGPRDGPVDSRKFNKVFAAKIVGKILGPLALADTVNTIIQIDTLMRNHGISKLVTIARITEYSAAWLTFVNTTDHLKDGTDVNGEEVAAVMEMFNGMEHSEGYLDIAASQSTARAPVESKLAMVKKAFAAEGDSESSDPLIEPITPLDQFNSDETGARKVENTYNESAGAVIGPIVAIPGLKAAASAGTAVLTALLTPVQPLIDAVVSGALSLDEKLIGVVAYFSEKLGFEPRCRAETSSPGRKFNCIDGGAVAVAEQLAQWSGGSKMTNEQVREQNEAILALHREEINGLSTWEKIADINRTESVAARFLVQLPSSFSDISRSFNRVAVSTLGAQQFNPISWATVATKPTYAATLDSNIYNAERFGVPEEKLKEGLFGNKSEENCAEEIEEFDRQMSEGKIPPVSMCKIDTKAGDNFVCILDDNPCPDDLPTSSSGGSTPRDPSGEVSGDARELATKILELADSGKITLNVLNSSDLSDRSTPRQNLEDIKSGRPAQTTQARSCIPPQANAPNQTSEVNLNLLKFIADYGQNDPININAIVGQCHSPTSNHYKGIGLDIDCANSNGAKFDEVARRYNGADNGERCDTGTNHYHYDFSD